MAERSAGFHAALSRISFSNGSMPKTLREGARFGNEKSGAGAGGSVQKPHTKETKIVNGAKALRPQRRRFVPTSRWRRNQFIPRTARLNGWENLCLNELDLWE